MMGHIELMLGSLLALFLVFQRELIRGVINSGLKQIAASTPAGQAVRSRLACALARSHQG